MQASACSAQSAWPHTVATDLQELPPGAKGPTTELMATQLEFHLATIRGRSKLFHTMWSSPTLWPYLGAFLLGGLEWLGVVGAPTEGSPEWHVQTCFFHIKGQNTHYLCARIKKLTLDPSL